MEDQAAGAAVGAVEADHRRASYQAVVVEAEEAEVGAVGAEAAEGRHQPQET